MIKRKKNSEKYRGIELSQKTNRNNILSVTTLAFRSKNIVLNINSNLLRFTNM